MHAIFLTFTPKCKKALTVVGSVLLARGPSIEYSLFKLLVPALVNMQMFSH